MSMSDEYLTRIGSNLNETTFSNENKDEEDDESEEIEEELLDTER